MRVLLIPNFSKEKTSKILPEICALLTGLGFTCVGLDDSRGHVAGCGIETVEYGRFDSNEATAASCDFILSIGGDGTIIHSAYYGAVAHRPLVGVNAGSLGFLAQLEPDRLERGFRRILSGDYTIERRAALSASVPGTDGFSVPFAINDIVVSKTPQRNIADFTVSCNGRPIDRYPADGIIFSTPTGSTAYGLAAGGPVIDPALSTISLIAICPHSIAIRPILFSGEKELSLICTSGEAQVHADGKIQGILRKGDVITIRKSPLEAEFISFKDYEFFEVLTAKLKQKG